MTLHRALAELKTLDARVEKGIKTIETLGFCQDGKAVNNMFTKEDFTANAKSKYQSVIDLIERKNKIKTAVVRANATTNITINGKVMTISDAINFKSVIALKQALLNSLINEKNKVYSSVGKANEAVYDNAIQLAKHALQKDNVKIGDNDAVAITEPFIKKNEYAIFDPLKIDAKIEELQNEISGFTVEIDACLSEINAITTIEI